MTDPRFPKPRWRGGRSVHRPLGRMAGLAGLVGLVGLVLVGPALAPNDPSEIRFSQRLIEPGAVFPLGTDHLGRCVLSRLLHGLQVTPVAAVTVVALSAGIGSAIGLAAGYTGGWLDRLAMRITDGILIFPAVAMAMVVASLIGIGLTGTIVSLAVVHWAEYARLVRTMILAERAKPYELAARALGAGPIRILVIHLLPNILSAVVVLATVSLAWAILSFSGLSFLGLGAEPGAAEWGRMIADGRTHMRTHPHLVIVPGLAIALFVLAVNLLGDVSASRQGYASPRAKRPPSRKSRKKE